MQHDVRFMCLNERASRLQRRRTSSWRLSSVIVMTAPSRFLCPFACNLNTDGDSLTRSLPVPAHVGKMHSHYHGLNCHASDCNEI